MHKSRLLIALLASVVCVAFAVTFLLARSPQPKTTLDCSSVVYSIALSPDGSQLASLTDDKIVLWSLANGQRIHDFNRSVAHGPGSIAQGSGVDFSPDGSLLAIGEGAAVRFLRLRDAGDEWKLRGHTQYRKGYPEHVIEVQFSPDGRRLVSIGSDDLVILWDVGGKQEILRIKGSSPSVAFSPTNGTIAITHDNVIKIVDMETLDVLQVLTGHTGRWIRDLEFSPDGTRLATSSGDGTVRIWNPKTGRSHGIIKHPDWVWRLAFSPDGKLLAAASKDGTVSISDSQTGETVMRHRLNASALALAFASETELVVASREFVEPAPWTDWAIIGRLLYRGGPIARTEGRIVIIDVARPKVSSSQEWSHDGIASPSIFDRRPNLVLTLGRDGQIKIWEVPASGKQKGPTRKRRGSKRS